MKMLRTGLWVAVFALAVRALGAVEAPAASPADNRLDHNVTVALKATALSDVCDRLRAAAGVKLTAGPSVEAEKVTLFCKELPLREVMRQLSRPFGYAW